MVTRRRAGEDLVSKSTRRAFRELCTGTVLLEIDGWWQDEGFAPGPENNEVGQRRSRYQQYLDSVDWTHRPHVVRALRVFEMTARGIEAQYVKQPFDLLRRDGYEVANDGQITGGPVVDEAAVREASLANLVDAGAIREHLDRIGRALESEDPAQAIGSAKELVESTAKVVLRERGLPVDDGADLPALTYQASTALGVHPSTQSPGPDGNDAVKKILGSAITITTGLAELRNRGFGTGHGAAAVPIGLGPRHAHLAVAGARLWCEFMLDTLADPKAPWRKSGAS